MFFPLDDLLPPASERSAQLTILQLIVQLSIATFFGGITAAIHYFTSPASRRADRSFSVTLVLLSIFIAVLTIVIGNNQARAFSLVGVLAIVRFRTVVEDTRDISFVIFSVVVGMAVGSGFYIESALLTPFVMAVAWFFRPLPLPKPASHGLLILRVAAGRPVDERVEQTLRSILREYHLVGITTARGGSAVDISYAIQLPTTDKKFFGLVEELGRIDGVQGVEIKEQ